MNIARLAAGVAVLTAIGTGLAAAKSTAVTADVNLRKGPGTDSEIITLIPKGTMVDIGTCANGWCMVTFNGMDGFSIQNNLGLAPPRRPAVAQGDYPPPPEPYPPPPPGYVVGPPVYYGPPPVYYYGGPYYYGPGWRGGWAWRHRW